MDDIPGSKPRKLIRRQNFSNPSLVSYSIKPLFDPQNQLALNERQRVRQLSTDNIASKNYRLHNRSRSHIALGGDTLQLATEDFLKSKKQHSNLPSVNIIPHINRAAIQQALQEKLKLSVYKEAGKVVSIENSGKFNLIRSDSIKAKQRHGFDIISGMSHG